MNDDNNYCEYEHVHDEVVEQVAVDMPDEDLLADAAELFKIFGDSTRIRILWALFDKELCVFDISEALDMSQSAISHQLRTLKQARLVKSRRNGKNTFYSLDDEHVKRIIEQVLIHINE